jgi:hypothetical protein
MFKWGHDLSTVKIILQLSVIFFLVSLSQAENEFGFVSTVNLKEVRGEQLKGYPARSQRRQSLEQQRPMLHSPRPWNWGIVADPSSLHFLISNILRNLK